MNNVTLAQDKNTPPVEDGVQRTTVSTLKIVLAYASFASLWILLSDKAVEWLLNDPATITLVSMLKGWFFVAVTSVLLYGLIKQQVDQVLKAHLRELDAHKEKARAKQLLDNIANSSPDAIFAKDLQGRYLLYNRETARIVGKPADQALGCDDTALFPAEQARMLLANDQRVIAENQIKVYEETLATADGERIFLAIKGPLIDENGHTMGLFGISRDITERKLAEQALQVSLAEKVALLNEVHHRVKNNLQVITSLLRLEAGRSSQADTKAVLGEMQGRIRSMALLHESLYRTGIFASVDLGAYLSQLATQAFRAMSPHSGTIGLKLDMASTSVSMDQAAPCGLLVNELIANSLKHGFPAGRSGEVVLSLQPVPGTDQMCLCVCDTGVGLPADFETRRGQSLGLQLVSDLTQQVAGALEVGPGTRFSVTFTPDKITSQVDSVD